MVVALTTNLADRYFGDCDINAWQQAGLPRPSKSKGVIQTIERATVERRLGTLTASDFERVKQSLREIMAL